jgi:hypothetical protein
MQSTMAACYIGCEAGLALSRAWMPEQIGKPIPLLLERLITFASVVIAATGFAVVPTFLNRDNLPDGLLQPSIAAVFWSIAVWLACAKWSLRRWSSLEWTGISLSTLHVCYALSFGVYRSWLFCSTY